MKYPCPTNYNPADHYILTLAIIPGQEEECKARANAFCDAYLMSDKAAEIEDGNNDLKQSVKISNSYDDGAVHRASMNESRYDASLWTQFRYLMWRSWICQFRDDVLFKVRVIQCLIEALFLGLIYLQLNITQKGVTGVNGALFSLVTSTSFSNLFAVVGAPVFIATVFLFGTITYWMIGFYDTFVAYMIAMASLLLTSFTGISCGYLISTACGTVNLALAVAPVALVPFMLLGGFFINPDEIPVYLIWLKYMSWFKYATEILMINQWTNVDTKDCGNSTSANGSSCLFPTGQSVLEYNSMNTENTAIDVVALVCLMVGFRLLAYLALLLRARSSKE